jgi:hypothetical protein
MFGTLFGSELPLAARFFIAFLIVLALIGLTAWLVRRFGASRLGNANARGRQPRLAVIDAATVDGRRRLVLIRRDNVEHLLMIGGPTDVVVEPNIVRAIGATARETTRVEPAMRAAPASEGNWPLQPASEPTSISAQRASRAPAAEEPWLSPEPGARPRPSDSLTGLAAELSARLNPPDLAPPPARTEPAPRAIIPAPAHEPSPQGDHNLAEMAQQLEAALRRGPGAEGRPPVTDPLALSANGKGGDMPSRPPRDFKSRMEPKFEPNRSELRSRPEPRPEPRFDSKFDAGPPPAPGKQLYENLEDEMASLLGRPSGKT